MNRNTKRKRWNDYKSKKYQKIKYRRKRIRKKNYISFREEKSKLTNYNYYNNQKTFKKVPEIFSFVNNTRMTIEFFDDIINEINKKIYRNCFVIQSEQVKQVTVDALIYLIAIMHNLKINYEMQYRFGGDIPLNKAAALVYTECGFMDFVNSRMRKLPSNTKKMRIISGTQNNPKVTRELCKFTMERLGKKRLEILDIQKILIELMSNVYHHAYHSDNMMKKSWYIYAENIDNYVRFIFVDTGVGIARTVKKNFREKISRRFGSKGASDSELIYSTLSGEFRTETNERYRGNGLSGVRELINSDLFKAFTVISGYGKCYVDENKKLQKENYSMQIYGTIFIFDVQ